MGRPRPVPRGRDSYLFPPTMRVPNGDHHIVAAPFKSKTRGDPAQLSISAGELVLIRFGSRSFITVPLPTRRENTAARPPLLWRRPHEACSGQLATSRSFSRFAQWRLSLPSPCLETPLRPSQHLPGRHVFSQRGGFAGTKRRPEWIAESRDNG